MASRFHLPPAMSCGLPSQALKKFFYCLFKGLSPVEGVSRPNVPLSSSFSGLRNYSDFHLHTKSWILPSSLLWVRPEGHRLSVLLHLPLFPVWFFSWIKILGLQEEVSSPGLMNSLLLTERKNRIRKHPSFPSFPAKSEGNMEHSIRGSLLLEFLPSVGNSLASVTSLMDLAKTKGLLPWLAYNHMPYVSFRGFQ